MSDSVVRIGALELKFLVDETQGAGDLVMFEFVVPPNARVPAPHYHRDVDEAVYGLEGTLTTFADGKPHEVGRGDTVFIPREIVHHHESATEFHCKSPGRADARLHRAAVFRGDGRGGERSGQAGHREGKEIMLRHGLIPA